MLSLNHITSVNTLMPRQYSRHFTVDTFKRIFLNENARSWIKISLKFVPKGTINSITALIQLMAWCPPDNKPISEPMMVRLPTHICVTRPQRVKLIHNLLAQFLSTAINPTLLTYYLHNSLPVFSAVQWRTRISFNENIWSLTWFHGRIKP